MANSVADDKIKLSNFSIVAACSLDGGMGYKGDLPWPTCLKDLQHFKEITTKTSKPGLRNIIIMGRKTWDSLPATRKPLPNRLNIILTRQADKLYSYGKEPQKDVHFTDSLPRALRFAHVLRDSFENIFVIGGAEVYNEAIQMPECKKVYLTMINKKYPADVFFPINKLADEIGDFQCTSCKHYQDGFSFHEYVNNVDLDEEESFVRSIDFAEKKVEEKVEPKPSGGWSFSTIAELEKEFPEQETTWEEPSSNTEEYQYLNLVQDILDYGVTRDDRTGVGTKAVFGRQMRFDLAKSFPVLTTKTVFWKGVVEELLWLIRGSTNAKELSAKGIKIWDANSSREFLDKCGFKQRKEGDIGPGYAFQWRHFGAKYIDCDTDYTGQGIDQLAEVINKIKNKPTDRRIIMSAWNPSDLKEMVLPPCHMFCQFFVADGKLSCQMYQRSCDMMLGVPFNIASYALLTCMLAQVCGLQPGEFIHVLGDTHIYLTHIPGAQEQLTRKPFPFPKLELNPNIKNIEDFKFEDCKLVNYQHHPNIKFPLAV